VTTSLEQFKPEQLNDGGLGVRSVEILLAGQDESGAFIASPNFPIYGFSWLRDGAFCARALDLVGHQQAASRFHRWVENVLLRHQESAEELIAKLHNGDVPPIDQMLPTRYALNGRIEQVGEIEDEPWPNYQLDGYGAWLHELGEHHRKTGLMNFNSAAVDLAARYLVAAWRTNCYDCWEEFGDGQHASTIGAIAAGLESAGELLGKQEFLDCAHEVRTSLFERFVRNGRFCKGATDDRLDASMLWLAVPFGVVELTDPAMQKTVEAIRNELRGTTGGIYRYLGDTYFGGGEWILLTCWLGWYDVLTANVSEYHSYRDWVIRQATNTFDLPEQSTIGSQDQAMIEPWVARWGPVATPLLWSHAMYLILSEAAQS
jgi:GH15 family glucan-1,4-alpha-glucosidase